MQLPQWTPVTCTVSWAAWPAVLASVSSTAISSAVAGLSERRMLRGRWQPPRSPGGVVEREIAEGILRRRQLVFRLLVERLIEART
jgi:hypothetical protein